MKKVLALIFCLLISTECYGAMFDNIVGKWKLDDAGTWADSSGNGNDLTLSSNAPTATTGHGGGANKAATFGGSPLKALQHADNASLSITGAITVAAWVNLTSCGAVNAMINKSAYQFSFDANCKMGGYLYNTANGYTFFTVSSLAVPTTAWHHVAWVFNLTDIRMYLDGALVNTPQARTAGMDDTADGFYVGTDGGGNYVDGKIDDVAIWSRALSATEVFYLAHYGDDFAVTLSGILKDRTGNVINASTYNTRVNVYPKNNTASAPTSSQLVTSADGVWTVSGLSSSTKYLVTFEYEGTYTPLGDVDIAGAAFLTPY